MASKLEQAMSARREQVEDEVRERYPDCQEISIAFFGADVIAEVKLKAGNWLRFRHVVEDDEVAAAAGEIGTRRREVIHSAGGAA